MTGLQAILLFGGIPLVLALVIVFAVAAPSWTRSSRGQISDLDSLDPHSEVVFISSGSATPNPSILPKEISAESKNLVGGGARASW